MMVSDEEKRWLVVGIAMNKVAAPVLRDFIKQGMDSHYANNTYCHGVTTPYTLKTLTYHQVSTDPCLQHLKFQNINNNLQLYLLKKKDLHKYNYNINSSVDLAKLFLPDYLAEFSGFDKSLDMSAILRLLGFNNPAPIFYSPNPLISIQLSADDVRENVRNSWGHCNVTDWTEVFFNDCFSKLKTLVRSLGLTPGMEKMALDELFDWETKGCQLCMGHAVDHNLLSLVQQDVKKLIMDYKTTEESLAQQRVDLTAMQNTVTSIQDQQSATRVQLEEHDEQLAAVLEWKELQMKDNEGVLLKLVSVEKMLSEELLNRVERVEKGLGETNDKVEQLGQGFAKTDGKVEQLEQGFSKTDATVQQLEQRFAETDTTVEQLEQGFAKTDATVQQLEQRFAETDTTVEQLEQGVAKTDGKVEKLEQGVAKTDGKVELLEQGFAKTDGKVEKLEQGVAKTDGKVELLEQGFAKIEKDASETGSKVKQLEEAVRNQRIKETKSEDSAVKTFDVKSCRSKLAEHYKRTASVPTSVWTKKSPVDIHQIYTRLSWVKEEQTLAGSSRTELKHYTDVFTANKNGVVPKRILVQGQTGIGKSTFVKKLSVDWAEIDDEIMGDTKKDALRRFEDGGDVLVSEVKEAAFQDYKDPSRSSVKSKDTSKNQKETLEKFELALVINLKEVSKCPSLGEIVRCCSIFPEEETALVDDLLSYITKNQEKVLLVFDGYDEYRCGSNSEIYEIFRGKKLRNCCVLITTRISKADELREFKDLHAEITGFSEVDRLDFMIKVLGSKGEAEELEHHLSRKMLTDLTRVPLLLLFFCTLWKNGKLKSFPENKTKLYLRIVQYVLDYNQGKDSPARFGKVHDFKEVLAEIGKVALECLLKDDHVFEYDELSDAIRYDGSGIIGLLQVTEYAENLRPAGLVSFIHKSIQEFLAAWYVTYRCVPEGNLGEIEQHARSIEECKSVENVFQFICGLSDYGAVKVLEHLKSVGISDPTLDLSKTIPDVEKETDRCPYVLTRRHGRFSDLVYDSFREVQSKAGLLGKCLDCTSGVILVTRDTLLSELIPDVNVLTRLERNLVFILGDVLFDLHGEDSIMYKSLKFLDCLQLPVRISESSDCLSVEDLITKLRLSTFDSIICLRDGRFQFYITELFLHCDDAKLFEQSTSIDVPSGAASLCSQQSCLKFLTVLGYHNLSDQTLKALGAVIRSCKHLYRIEVEDGEDSMCYLLEQVQNPSKCSVEITTCLIHPDGAVNHTSAGAVRLASLLPRFYSIRSLRLDVRDCCAAALDTMVTSIAHKIVKELTLSGIRLTPETAEALGRSLPKMSSLHELWLFGMDGCILKAEEMKSLFGRFNKKLPLYKCTFIGFSEIRCLAPFNRSLRFFPDLRALQLENLNVNEHDMCGLLERWCSIRKVTELRVCGNQPGRVYSWTSVFCTSLTLDGVNLTSAVATTLGGILPEMSSLQTLSLIGADGNVLQNKEMEALFGKLHTRLSLHALDISGYKLRGSLAPLIKSLRFFPNVIKLELYPLNMDEDDQCGLLESLKFIPDLTSLRVQSKPLGQEDCGTPILTLTYESSALRTKSLNLHGISPTPATIASLGRSLAEMSSLETLELTGLQDGRILQAEETEALFGGISKIMPLSDLNVSSGFSVIGSIAPLTNSFCFLPNLARLCLVDCNMDEHNLCSLLDSLQFIPKLMELKVYYGGVRPEHCHTAIAKPVSGFTHKALRKLELIDIDLTLAVAVALGRLLPEMLSLQNLHLQGLWFPRNVLKAERMEALFGGFNKRLPLVELYLSRLSAKGCSFGPVFKSFRFFPDLEQLNLREFVIDEHHLFALLESLKFLPNLKEMKVKGHAQFFPVKVDTLPSLTHNTLEQLKVEGVSITPVTDTLPSITHNSLKQLKLDGISLTPVTAALVGQLLSEVTSLETIELTGVYESSLQAVEMEALFCGFNKKLLLHWVTLRNFSLRGCLAKLCKGFHAFPNLKTLKLENISLSELDQCCLLESLRFIRSVRELSVKRDADRYSMQDRFSSFTLEAHEKLHLVGINLTPAAAAALGRSLPEMSSLQVLQLNGKNGSILQAEDIEALFGGFNKDCPLSELTLSGFSVRGCLSPLIRSLHFFSRLKELKLENLAIDEHDQCDLLKSFGFIRNLTTLSVRVSGKKCLDSFHYYAAGLKTVVSHAQNRVDLDGINLTPAVAVVLGQLLREMSFLQELTLTGMDGIVLGAEEMEALFGGLNKILPLYRLIFSGFRVRGSFASLHKSFRVFPNLKELQLSGLNMNEHDFRGLLESFQFIPNIQLLNLSGNPVGHAVLSIVPHVIYLKKLRWLWIDERGLSEEDLNAVQQALPGIHVEGAKTPIRVYCNLTSFL